jgi:hypothetical protein
MPPNRSPHSNRGFQLIFKVPRGIIFKTPGVREDTVRLWGGDFARGGVAALKTSPAPGPAPVKAEAALRVVTPLLEAAGGRPPQLDARAPHE